MLRRANMMMLAAGIVLGVAGCDTLTSPNFNFGDLDELQSNPTPALINTAATGLLVGQRQYYAQASNDIVGQLGLIGRESYNLDINDPRFEAEMLSANLSAASPAFGGNHWFEPYQNIRLGDIILTAVEQVGPAMPASDQEWVRGFTKTMNAIDFLWIVLLRDTNCGCSLEVPEGTEPAPTVGRDAVFAEVVRLLDEGAGHLAAASGPAPFATSSGFAGFNTAAGFLQVNRALRARVAAYLEDWAGVLSALQGSFIDVAAPFDLGVYHVFTQQSGDITNGYFEAGTTPNLRAHPSIKGDVELKADGTPDDRFTAKVRPITNRAYQGTICLGVPETAPDFAPDPRFKADAEEACDVGLAVYPTLTTPLPIIRNAELILLRAEANINLGNLGAAQTDLNAIRTQSGGLQPVTLTNQAQAIDRLLYERRFELFFEGGHRWIDMRRYDRIANLPLDDPSHGVALRYPIPSSETQGRQ